MSFNRQDGQAVQVGVFNRGRDLPRTFARMHVPQPSTSWEESPSSGLPRWGALEGYLLAWTAALSFSGGLFVLAVLPPLGVEVTRAFILASGLGCVLLALLALLLSRPWQQHQPADLRVKEAFLSEHLVSGPASPQGSSPLRSAGQEKSWRGTTIP
jgi:hypothetical protein